jgi:hypothetical protein
MILYGIIGTFLAIYLACSFYMLVKKHEES